jgi:hypothetical protein
MLLRLGFDCPRLPHLYNLANPTGHKRLRTASTPGLRAMSGLGTSPGSSGGRSGSSARIGAAAADEQQQQQSDDEMPLVQATSVAETIMDTMRSLEKVRWRGLSCLCRLRMLTGAGIGDSMLMGARGMPYTYPVMSISAIVCTTEVPVTCN